jgi:2-polyprenyl-3-methyl-5-hydroxy-6-metoxy-1,4-benzoquinol methylase
LTLMGEAALSDGRPSAERDRPQRMFFSRTIRSRRAALRSQFDVRREFETLEESCVPSYVHANIVAAWAAWSRLNKAAQLYDAQAPAGPILDFGSATGELRQVLDARGDYHFVEGNEVLAEALARNLPQARRESLESLGEGRFAAIFALDSLEHNDDIAPIVAAFARALQPGGVFILSGPTENVLYKLGRAVAGFSGHYHVQTIYDIERQVAERFSRKARTLAPVGVPLFAISAWTVTA